jgi:hydrogenase expression/formation protein HypE
LTDVANILTEIAGSCPLPQSQYDRVLLGHGSGGTLSYDLVRQVFVPGFGNEILASLEDQATVSLDAAAGGARLAFTTDSFVVRPIFFPGGDVGKLAVCGTVNDLAVGGATPMFLSAAFILEEGLPLADLKRIVASMRQACALANVSLVTGDTKVVDRGKGDQVFITTSGIGVVPRGRNLSIRNARPGDCVLVSGTIGDHGIAIMSVREGIEFETVLESDCAPLNDLVRVMLEACPEIRCMRAQRAGGCVECRRRAGRVIHPHPTRRARGLRHAGIGSTVRCQRREINRRRPGANGGPTAGGDAGPSIGEEFRPDWEDYG